jgi:quinone-modifying oxidoreductase subunit QmoC
VPSAVPGPQGTTGSPVALTSDPEFRAEFLRRGGGDAVRCFQCATCSAVCELAKDDALFPRRQMLWAQWGLADRLSQDASVWLCHQCQDCTARCPRDAKPGDSLQAIRSVLTERLAAPRFLGRLVGQARTTWPLLVGIPILFWALLIAATTGFQITSLPLVYGDVVPHVLIYSVFFSVTALVLVAVSVQAKRVWALWGREQPRAGSFLSGLVAVGGDILLHRRFNKCTASRGRTVGHLALFWGFIGAAVTSGLIVVAMYGLGEELPLPQTHPFKILGNISAVLLVVGAAWLVVNRLSGRDGGKSTAFDNFFLWLVVALVVSGVAVELGRYFLPPEVAVGIYVAHLGIVLSLFLTFPYSKFAHLLYRTLAMVHETMARRAASRSPHLV